MGGKAKFGAQRKEVKEARKVAESPARRVQEEERRAGFFTPEQEEEFVEGGWRQHWWGMPSFVMGNSCPAYQVIVNFFTFEDMQEFARRLDVPIQQSTRSIWFPPDKSEKPGDWVYSDTCWRDSHWGEFKLGEECRCRSCTVKRERTPGR